MTERDDTDAGGGDRHDAPPARSVSAGGLLRAAMGTAGSAWRSALGAVYPPSCAGCGGATADPHGLCAACWTGMRLIDRPCCERYGTPFALDLGVGPLLSPRAIADPPVFDRARAVALYEGTARELVQRLKYGDRLDLARMMAAMMVAAGREVLAEADLVVPIPLHARRLWARRFNQAALLAHGVARRAERPLALHALARVRATRSQVGLTRHQRGENLRGAFQVRARAVANLEGKRILLVDDVATTGATGNAAARVLRRAGAAGVDLLTFATVASDTG